MANKTVNLDPGDALAVNVASCPEPEPPPPDPDPDPDPEPLKPPGPLVGRPEFSEEEGTVRAFWSEVERATSYEVDWRGGKFLVDQPHVFLPLQSGDWLCVTPQNSAGQAPRNACNTYVATVPSPDPDPEPEPLPPVVGDWTLVHEFSPAAGETIPNGVDIRDGGFRGRNERNADGYLMVYTKGMPDGGGPGRIGIEKGAVPQGHRNLMCEYDITISANFEDHPVFNKIAHYRTKVPAREFDQIAHGAKFIDKFKSYKIGYAGDSGTGVVKAKFTPSADLKALYPDYWAGYNSVVGNVRQDRLRGGQKHTVRVEWSWLRRDATYSEGNWYRLRWWLDGVLQGDFPEFPMWGGPEFIYWEIAPTWGGNGGHIKTREDWMLISRIATWVR